MAGSEALDPGTGTAVAQVEAAFAGLADLDEELWAPKTPEQEPPRWR